MQKYMGKKNKKKFDKAQAEWDRLEKLSDTYESDFEREFGAEVDEEMTAVRRQQEMEEQLRA